MRDDTEKEPLWFYIVIISLILVASCFFIGGANKMYISMVQSYNAYVTETSNK